MDELYPFAPLQRNKYCLLISFQKNEVFFWNHLSSAREFKNYLFMKGYGHVCLNTQPVSLYKFMLCYVIGSRRLMPPDALQPKACCTNPGLQTFLLAPSGVSTRDPSSERRKYLGEKCTVIWTESCDFHAYTFGFFYKPQIFDMGQTALLHFRRKTCWGFFSPWKIRRLRPGLNPRTWVPKASTLYKFSRAISPHYGIRFLHSWHCVYKALLRNEEALSETSVILPYW